MNFSSVKVLLSNSRGLIPSLIRWQTRSQYSHAALLFERDNGCTILIESRMGDGVRCESPWIPNPKTRYDQYSITDPRLDVNACYKFAEAQFGKRYDMSSVLRFISRQQASRKSAGVWFCYELVFAAIQKGGLSLFVRCEPWMISGSHLEICPYLIYEKTYHPV